MEIRGINYNIIVINSLRMQQNGPKMIYILSTYKTPPMVELLLVPKQLWNQNYDEDPPWVNNSSIINSQINPKS